MFCSNCGKPIADDAKFCSSCGAKTTPSAGSVSKNNAPAPEASKPFGMEMEWDTNEIARPKKVTERRVSFDWSSVIDETHRKPRVEVKSPWDTPGYDDISTGDMTPGTMGAARGGIESEIFPDSSVSRKTDDRGRTLTFIDILKQERDEKERLSYEAARRTEDDMFDKPGSPTSSSILPEEERIITKGYTDLKTDIIAEMENGTPSAFDEQFENAKKRRTGQFTPVPPRSYIDNGWSDMAGRQPAPYTPEPVEDEFETLIPGGEDTIEAILDRQPVEDEFAEPEAPEINEPDAIGEDLFEEEPKEEETYDDYMDYVPRGRADRHRYEDSDDDDFDSDDDEDEVKEQVPEPASPSDEEADTEEPVGEESIKAVDDEIAELQKKLDVLLGAKSEAEAEAEAKKEEEAPLEDTPQKVESEYFEDEDIFNAELVNDEPETEELKDDVVVEIEEPTEPEEEQTFEDPAVSVEELLNDLLPEEAMSDEPIASEEIEEEAAEEAAPVQEIGDVDLTETTEDAIFGGDSEMNLDAELENLGFSNADAEPEVPKEPEYSEEDMLFTSETTDTSGTADTVALGADDIAAQEALSIEELERDLFGEQVDGVEDEATKKIEKFYTLYRKNEEFQKLLNDEYDKLQGSKYDVATPENEVLGDEPDLSELTAVIEEQEKEDKKQEEITAAPEVHKGMVVSKSGESNASGLAKSDKSDKSVKSDKKSNKKSNEDDDEAEGGGGILTVFAIVIAVLLVVLLAVILVLNFAPESSIAQTLNEVIGNFTNFFASNDNTELLL